MEPILNFAQLTAHLKKLNHRKRIAVVCANDPNTEYAISRALEEGIAEFLMIGDSTILKKYPTLKQYPEYVKTIQMEIPTYHKLLFFSDAAVIPRPTLQQRIEMIWYAICTCRHFGIEQPRVALIHCTEKVSAKFPHSLDYVNIVELAEAGEFGNVIIDGPLDVRTACEQASGDIKGIVSPINGQADVLIFPNIESGNAFYKSVSLFAQAEMAGLLQGPICPVVLPSRSDSGLSKYYSIAMACLQVSGDCKCRKQVSQVTGSSF